MCSSSKTKSLCWITQHGNPRWNATHDHTAGPNYRAIPNRGATGDDRVGVDGDEVPDTGTTGNCAVAVDLAPVAYLCIVANNCVLLNAGEFADVAINRNANLGRNDAATPQLRVAADVGARMNDSCKVDVVHVT